MSPNTGGIDWAYPRADETSVRRPATGRRQGGTLGSHFVRLLGFEGTDSEPAPGRMQWARVAMPNGKQGFVAPRNLMSLTTERLCYIKDLVGGWRIAGSSPAATRSNFRKQEKCAVEPARPQQRLILT